ncbi:MAG: hypothetical protein KGL43_03990 [Burkholderiales bacterium]|nr:hypothetical protein [Burkholderiales bacterium]MDE2396772.1 hypothetical protein [Burkholderiales bacterium]MDE2452731.1 hypothetical protein [Burkholderiales bacterium]
MRYSISSIRGDGQLVLLDARGRSHLGRWEGDALAAGTELHGPCPALGLGLLTTSSGLVVKMIFVELDCSRSPSREFTAQRVADRESALKSGLRPDLRAL